MGQSTLARTLTHLVTAIALLIGSTAVSPQAAGAQDSSAYDMVIVASTGACVTVLGDTLNGAGIGTRACRGTDAQYWRIDQSGYWHTKLDDTYCLAHSSGTSSTLAMARCTDERALATTERSDVTKGYVKTGTNLAFDVASSGEMLLYPQHSGSNQRFSWLQPSLEYLTTHAGHEVSYPLSLDDTLSYEIEIVRDRVARIQPPFEIPSSARRSTVFPGTVGGDAQWVTREYTFDLNFRDHGYLRMAAPPRNWMSTGLYAPPGQIITVTVSDATDEAMRNVYVQLGSATDRLLPTSGNVISAGHVKRPPSVAFSVKLEPGENLIRTPYGGPVILRSDASFNDTIQVRISAVQAPYFKLGQTTEAEWLAVRNSPTPMGELESNRFAVHVMADQLAERTYAEMVALAQTYDRIADLTDELAGLSPTAALPHTSPMGKHRISQDIHISAGWGHSGFPIQVFPEWPLVDPGDMVTRSSAWGVWHELGHNYQMGAWSYAMGTEVTVNWWSLYNQQRMFGDSRVINYGFYPDMLTLLRDSSVTDKWTAGDAGQQLALFDQLRILHPTLDWQLYTRIIRAYREKSNSAYDALQTEAQKRDEFIRLFCEVSGSNAVPHFAAWNLTVTNATRTFCAAKRALPARSWLVDGSISRHSGKGNNSMLVEEWTGVGSSGLTALTADTAFPTSPSSSAVVTGSFELANNSRDNDARRVRAWLHPPVSGPYRFWLSGNDQAELLLSTGTDATTARSILRIEEPTGQRGFDDIGIPLQRSAVITLTANQRYYIELRQTDVDGGDHATVAWEIPAGAGVVAETRRPIEGKFLSAFTGDVAMTLARQPNSSAAIRPGSTTTVQLTVKNNSTMPISRTAVMLTVPDGFAVASADAAAWQTGWRYVRLEALNAANGGVHASARELEVLDANGALIDRSNWRIHRVSNEETLCDGDAIHAIDGDPETIWHTRWCLSALPFPHSIAIDMGSLQSVGGVVYTPRSPGANGNIGEYRIAVSADGSTWTQVATGTWANADDGEKKTVTFTAPQSPYQRIIETRIAANRTASVTVRLTARANLAPRRYSVTAGIRAAYDDAGALFQTNARNDTATLNITVVR